MKKALDLKKTGRKHFYAAAQIDDYLYFSNWWSKGLFRANLKSGEVELLDVFESNNSGKLYGLAIPFGEEVWFIPRTYEEKIAIYHVKKETLEYLSLPSPKHLGQYELFKNYYVIDETVWLIPYSYDTVLKIGMADRKVVRLEDGIENIVEEGWPRFVSSYKNGEKIFLCPWGYDKVVVVNTATLEMTELNLDVSKRTFRNVFSVNNKLYLIPFDIEMGLLEYDLLTQKCANIKLEENLSGKYVAMYYDEEKHKLVFFPYSNREMLFIDIGTWKSETVTIQVSGQELTSNPYWCEVRNMKDHVWVIGEESGFSELIYGGENDIEIFDPHFPKDIFMNEIKLMLDKDKDKKCECDNVGASIYRTILGQEDKIC